MQAVKEWIRVGPRLPWDKLHPPDFSFLRLNNVDRTSHPSQLLNTPPVSKSLHPWGTSNLSLLLHCVLGLRRDLFISFFNVLCTGQGLQQHPKAHEPWSHWVFPPEGKEDKSKRSSKCLLVMMNVLKGSPRVLQERTMGELGHGLETWMHT